MKLKKVPYQRLNSRQKENFNFQKVSAILADYGFVTFRLSDDRQGADFIALHINGDVLRVQLKSRLTFSKKYEGKGLHVAFGSKSSWYLYPLDELLGEFLSSTTMGSTTSWRQHGAYSFPRLSEKHLSRLEPFRISGDAKPLPE